MAVDAPNQVAGNKSARYGALVDTSGNPLFGQKTMANSMPVAIASDQGALKIQSAAAGGLVADGATATLSVFPDSSGTARILAVMPYAMTGASADRVRRPVPTAQVALAAATAETTVWTPAASRKFRLMGFILTASAQTVLTFKDGIGGATILTVELAANVPLHAMLGNGKLSAAANNVLTVTRATSAILNGTLMGTEE